jgi:hypothetical protein
MPPLKVASKVAVPVTQDAKRTTCQPVMSVQALQGL